MTDIFLEMIISNIYFLILLYAKLKKKLKTGNIFFLKMVKVCGTNCSVIVTKISNYLYSKELALFPESPITRANIP